MRMVNKTEKEKDEEESMAKDFAFVQAMHF